MEPQDPVCVGLEDWAKCCSWRFEMVESLSQIKLWCGKERGSYSVLHEVLRGTLAEDPLTTTA